MKLIDQSLRNSTAVIVGMILTILFGVLAVINIPIQLNPTIDRPFITVETIYPGASATEVEQELTRPMEERLAAVENLIRMRSTSSEGMSRISLEFEWGIDKNIASMDVLQKLNLVPDLPDDAEEPQILTVNRMDEEIVIFAHFESDLPLTQLYELADDQVVPQLERVEGVAGVQLFGGSEREVHVLVDLQALAARDITLSDVASALARENRNVRGGKIDMPETRLIVRTVGQYQNLEEIRQDGRAQLRRPGPVRIATSPPTHAARTSMHACASMASKRSSLRSRKPPAPTPWKSPNASRARSNASMTSCATARRVSPWPTTPPSTSGSRSGRCATA